MPDYSDITDLELISLLKKKDHSAFTEIYNKHWRTAFIHALKILRDEEQASDVLQEIFTTLWCRTDDWQLESSLSAYLYASVRNRCFKVIAKSNRKEAFIDELSFAFTEGINTTDEELSVRELNRFLETEVMALPPKMQQVYIKSRKEGLSHRQIAEDMGIAENSVKTTMHRTLNLLRTKLSPLLSLFII